MPVRDYQQENASGWSTELLVSTLDRVRGIWRRGGTATVVVEKEARVCEGLRALVCLLFSMRPDDLSYLQHSQGLEIASHGPKLVAR
jgi:hypothetical protein